MVRRLLVEACCDALSSVTPKELFARSIKKTARLHHPKRKTARRRPGSASRARVACRWECKQAAKVSRRMLGIFSACHRRPRYAVRAIADETLAAKSPVKVALLFRSGLGRR